MSSAPRLLPTRVLEWVRCGDDRGIDGLLHARPVRAAGVQFVRVQDALRLTATESARRRAERLEANTLASAPSGPFAQGASGSGLARAMQARAGGRPTRPEESVVSLVQFVKTASSEGWAGHSAVGAPAQGAVGPLSMHTLVGAARGVSVEVERTSETRRREGP